MKLAVSEFRTAFISVYKQKHDKRKVRQHAALTHLSFVIIIHPRQMKNTN